MANEPETFYGPGATWLTPQHRQSIRQQAENRALKRVEEREHLRLELKARHYIQTCHNIAQTLVLGYEDRVDEQGGLTRLELSRARVQSLKAAAEISLRMLDRVLPPLKAVEIQDSPEKDMKDVAKMSTMELLKIIHRQQDSIPGEVEREEEYRPFG